MAEAFLDSSIVIGLHFRHAGERAHCASAIPDGAEQLTSRYVIFEIARGFLRSLLLLHNASFEYRTFSEFHQAAHSGQLRFQPYRMHTQLGAFDDYFAALEAEDGTVTALGRLAEFRAKLRTWIRRGWKQMHAKTRLTNSIGCRDDLQPPFVRTHDRHLHQELPTTECGTPAACGLDDYLIKQAASLSALRLGLRQRPASDRETERRIAALGRLVAKARGESFMGTDCYRCGDAFICHESPVSAVVVSKNRKHFAVICELLGKAATFPEEAARLSEADIARLAPGR